MVFPGTVRRKGRESGFKASIQALFLIKKDIPVQLVYVVSSLKYIKYIKYRVLPSSFFYQLNYPALPR